MSITMPRRRNHDDGPIPKYILAETKTVKGAGGKFKWLPRSPGGAIFASRSFLIYSFLTSSEQHSTLSVRGNISTGVTWTS